MLLYFYQYILYICVNYGLGTGWWTERAADRHVLQPSDNVYIRFGLDTLNSQCSLTSYI